MLLLLHTPIKEMSKTRRHDMALALLSSSLFASDATTAL
jgi:hypothetical protein